MGFYRWFNLAWRGEKKGNEKCPLPNPLKVEIISFVKHIEDDEAIAISILVETLIFLKDKDIDPLEIIKIQEELDGLQRNRRDSLFVKDCISFGVPTARKTYK